ncbi:hypothetical protein [Gordonia shandongensis]|uniref:hypothetical protein n=1 Tax=Gordonia shandongensis TaxID=376351 RepID=UPI000422241A|nr:hypothetical protein [Gordonia shandongensis]
MRPPTGPTATAARVAAAVIAVGAGALALTACSPAAEETAVSAPPTAPAGEPASTERLPATDCEQTPESGKVDTTGYALRYSTGTMRISVRTKGGSATCLGFTKTGSADPQVPPDTVLFTFRGSRGEGALLEFPSVNLSRGVLPWPRGKVTTPHSTFTSTVGVSHGGDYFTSQRCTVRLARVTPAGAAGTVECPDALATTANPFDPSDDVSHEDPADRPSPPDSASLRGVFELAR